MLVVLALLKLLKIDPEMVTALTDACACNFSVQLISAPTSASEPDCHTARGRSACVIPRGFPFEPALGLALTGDKRVLEITWSVNHPLSAFAPGSSGWVLPEDVELLNAAGLNCHTVQPFSPTPVTPVTPVQPSKGSAFQLVAVCVGGCCLVALLAGVAVFTQKKSSVPADLLLSTQDSAQYTEALVYKA